MVEAPETRRRRAAWSIPEGANLVFDPLNSQGVYLRDRRSGRDYLDFSGAFAPFPLSYDHPDLTDSKFLQALARAARIGSWSDDIYGDEPGAFLERFGRVALGGEFENVLVVDGAALGLEHALRAAFNWKHRRNSSSGGGSVGSYAILHFRDATHGHTGYAISLNDSLPPSAAGSPTFEWPRVLNPKLRFPLDASALAEARERESQSLAEIERAFDERSREIAAVLIEPIQGEGGDNYFRSEFLQELRRVCDERGALLIFDETQTGLGVTGQWWDWQHHQVKPDLLCFGDRAQVSGFASTARLLENDGNAVNGCEASLAAIVRCAHLIDIIEEDELIDNAKTMGNYMLRLLRELADAHSMISNVRGRGLWAAFDLPTPEDRARMLRTCFEEALLVFPSGDRTIGFRPALDIDADSIARAVAQAEAAFNKSRVGK